MEWIHFIVITLIYIHEPKTVTWATEYEIPDYAYSEKRRKNQYGDGIEYVNRENDRQKNYIYNSKSMGINTKKKLDCPFKDCHAIHKREPRRYRKYVDKSHYRNRVLTPFFNKCTRYIPMDRNRPYGYNRLEMDLQKNGLDIRNLKNHRHFESTDLKESPTIKLLRQDAETRNGLTEVCGFTSDSREANQRPRAEDRGGDFDSRTVKNKNLTSNNFKETFLKNKTVIHTIQNKYKDILNGMIADNQRNANTDNVTPSAEPSHNYLITSQPIYTEITEGLPEERTTTRYKTAFGNDPAKPSIVSYNNAFKETTTSNRNLLTVKINTTLKYREGVTTVESVRQPNRELEASNFNTNNQNLLTVKINTTLKYRDGSTTVETVRSPNRGSDFNTNFQNPTDGSNAEPVTPGPKITGRPEIMTESFETSRRKTPRTFQISKVNQRKKTVEKTVDNVNELISDSKYISSDKINNANSIRSGTVDQRYRLHHSPSKKIEYSGLNSSVSVKEANTNYVGDNLLADGKDNVLHHRRFLESNADGQKKVQYHNPIINRYENSLNAEQTYGPGISSTDEALNDDRGLGSDNGEKLKSQTDNTHDLNLIKLRNILGRSAAKDRETLKTKSLQRIKRTDRERIDSDIKEREKPPRTDKERIVKNLNASVGEAEYLVDMNINNEKQRDLSSRNRQNDCKWAGSGSTLPGKDVMRTPLKRFEELYDKLQRFQWNKEFSDSDVALKSLDDDLGAKSAECPASAVSERADRNYMVTERFINCDLSDDNPMEGPSKIENEMFKRRKTRTEPEMKNKIPENELYADEDGMKRDIHCCFQLNDKRNSCENLEKAKLKQIDLKIQNKKKNGCPLKETLIEMVLTKDGANASDSAVQNIYRYDDSSECDRKYRYSTASTQGPDVNKSNGTEDAADETDSNSQRLAVGKNEKPADGKLESKYTNTRLNSDRDWSSKIRFLNYLNKFRDEIGKNNSEITRGSPAGTLDYLEGIGLDRGNPIESSKAPQVGRGKYNSDTVKSEITDAKKLTRNNEIESKIMKKCENLKNNISTILNMLSIELKNKNMSRMDSGLHSDELFCRGRCTEEKSKAPDRNRFKNPINAEEKNAVNSKDLNENDGKVIWDVATDTAEIQETDRCNSNTSSTAPEMRKDNDTGGGQSRTMPDKTTFAPDINTDEKASESDWDWTENSNSNAATTTHINITDDFDNNDTPTADNGKDWDLIKTVKETDSTTKINGGIPIPLLNLHVEGSVGEKKQKNRLEASIDNVVKGSSADGTSSTTNYFSNSDLNKISMQIKSLISAADSNAITARPQGKDDGLPKKLDVTNRTSGNSGDSKKEKAQNCTEVCAADFFDMNKFTNIAQHIQSIPNRVALSVMSSLFLNEKRPALRDPVENKWKRDVVYANKWTRPDDKRKTNKKKSKSKKYKYYTDKNVEATDENDIRIKTVKKNSRKKKIKQIYMPNAHRNRPGIRMEPPFFFGDDIITISVTPYDNSANSSREKISVGHVMLNNDEARTEKSCKDRDRAMLNEAKYFVITDTKVPNDKTKSQQTQMKKLHLKQKGNEKSGIRNTGIENVTKQNKLVGRLTDINTSSSPYEMKHEMEACHNMAEKIDNAKQFKAEMWLNQLEPSTRTPLTKVATCMPLLLKTQENKNGVFDRNRDYTRYKQTKEFSTRKYSEDSINDKSDRIMAENEEFIVTLKLKPNNELRPTVAQVESIENPQKITDKGKEETEEAKTINVHTTDINYETDYVATENYMSCTETHSVDSTSIEKSWGLTGDQTGRINATSRGVERWGTTTESCYTTNELRTERNESVQSTYQWVFSDDKTTRTDMRVCETTAGYGYYDDSKTNRNESRISDISREKEQKAVTYNETDDRYRADDIEKQTRANDENLNYRETTEMQYRYEPDISTDSYMTLGFPTSTSTIIYQSSKISAPDTSGWRTETVEKEVTKSSVLENTIPIGTRDMETSSKDKEDEKEEIESEKDRKDGGPTDEGRNISYPDTYTRLTSAPPTREQIEEPVDDSDKIEDEDDDDDEEERENEKAIENQTGVCMRQTETNSETPPFVETTYDLQDEDDDDDDLDDEDDQEDTQDDREVMFWQIVTKKPGVLFQKTQSTESEEDSETATTGDTLQPQSFEIDMEAVKSQLEKLLAQLKDGHAVDGMSAFLTVEPDSELTTELIDLSDAYLNKYNGSSQRDAITHRNSTEPSPKVDSSDSVTTAMDGKIRELKIPSFSLNINISRGTVFTEKSSATPHPSRYNSDTDSPPPGIIEIKNSVGEGEISEWKESLNTTPISMEKDNSNETRKIGIIEDDLKNMIYTWRYREMERTSQSNRSIEDETTEVASTYSMASDKDKVISKINSNSNNFKYSMFDLNGGSKVFNLLNPKGLNRTIPSNDSYDDSSEVILLDNASSDPAEWVLHEDVVSNIDRWGDSRLSDRNEDSDERNKDIMRAERIEAELNNLRQDAVREEPERQNSNYINSQKLFVKLIREPFSRNCSSSNRHNRKYFKVPRIDSEPPKIIGDQELAVSSVGRHPLPLKEDKEMINSGRDNKGFSGARIRSQGIKKYETVLKKQHAPRTFPVSYRSEANYFEEKHANEISPNNFYASDSRQVKDCKPRAGIENGRNVSAVTSARENDNARKTNRKKEGRKDHWEMLDDSLSKAENIFDKSMIRKIDQNFRTKLEKYNIKPHVLGNGKIENSGKSSLNDLNFYNYRLNRKFKLQNSVRQKDNNANITPEEEKKIKKIMDEIISRYKGNKKDLEWRRHKTNKFDFATMRNAGLPIGQRKNTITGTVPNKKCKSYPTDWDPSTYPSRGCAAGIADSKFLVRDQFENSRFESELSKSTASGEINKKDIDNRLHKDIVKILQRAAGTKRRRIQSDTPGGARETAHDSQSRIGTNDAIEEASFDETDLYTENDNRSLDKLSEGERNLLIIDEKKEERDRVPLHKIISPNPYGGQTDISQLINLGVVFHRNPPVDSRDSSVDGVMKDSERDNENSHENNTGKQKDFTALPKRSKECKTNEIKENEELKGKIETSDELINYTNQKNMDSMSQFKQENYEPLHWENENNVSDKDDKKMNKSDFMKIYKALLKTYGERYDKSEQFNSDDITKDAMGKKTKGVTDAGKKISSKGKDDVTVQRPDGKNKKKDYKLNRWDRGKEPEKRWQQASECQDPAVKQVLNRGPGDDGLENLDDIEIEVYDDDVKRITENEISMNNGTRNEGNGTPALRDNLLVHRQHKSPPVSNKIKYWENVDAENLLIQTPKTKETNENEVMKNGRVNTLLNKFNNNLRPNTGVDESNRMYKTSWENLTLARPFPKPKFNMMATVTEETIRNESSENYLDPPESSSDESPAPPCENKVLLLPIKFNTSEFIKLLDYNKDDQWTQEREEKINKWNDSERNSYVFDINRGPNGLKSRYFITFDSQAPNTVQVKNISTIPIDEFKNMMANRGRINNALSDNIYFSNKKNIQGNIKPEIRSIEKVGLWLKKPLCYNVTHQVPKVVISLGEVWPPMRGSLASPMMKHYLVQVDPLIKPSKFPNQHVDYQSQISKVVWKALLHGFKTSKKNWELTKQLSK